MNTVEFYIEVIDGNPIQLINRHAAPPKDLDRALAYWALSADATGDYPPVLMHIYYRGELPDDAGRDRINAAVVDYVGKLLSA